MSICSHNRLYETLGVAKNYIQVINSANIAQQLNTHTHTHITHYMSSYLYFLLKVYFCCVSFYFWQIPIVLTCDISCFRYGNRSFIDERHRHRYEVCPAGCFIFNFIIIILYIQSFSGSSHSMFSNSTG